MSAFLVLTAIGVDRPGLVELLSQTVVAHQGNWLESRMSHLAGKFAGILRVSVPDGSVEALTRALLALDAEGLRVVVERSEGGETHARSHSDEGGTPAGARSDEGESPAGARSDEGESPAGARSFALELVGSDRPGIVRDISRALARRGVNVEELSSECSSAPMSGEALFRATARLRLPVAVSIDALRGDLEEIATDLMVDISLDDAG